jgi:uncharacterized protein (TIGR00661 family)
MAKIVLSVHGDGIGEAIRALAVYRHLKSDNIVHITATDIAYRYLKGKVKNLHKIEGNRLEYHYNEVLIGKTLADFIRTLPKIQKKNFKRFMKLLADFRPNIIISMLEPFSVHFASFFGIPVISLTYFSLLTRCYTDHEISHFYSYWESRLAIDFFERHADAWLVPSFVDVEPKDAKRTFLVPPILRKQIYAKKPSDKGHFLVYRQSGLSLDDIDVLSSMKERFIVYEDLTTKRIRNVSFRKFSEKNFISDLASCRAVITDGDFGVIAEALQLGKPVLCIPPKKQYIKVFLSSKIAELGYGDWHDELTRQVLRDFSKEIFRYRSNLMDYNRSSDNSTTFSRLDHLISELSLSTTPIMKITSGIAHTIVPKKKELTLTIIKPDAVKKNIIGGIISYFEKQKIRPVAIKMMRISDYAARKFYSQLEGKVPTRVFESIVRYMSSGKVVLIVWHGKDVVGKVHKLCGATDPKKAKKSTIRGRFSDDSLEERAKQGKAVRNVIHSSDNAKDAKREINFFFRRDEII